MIAVYITPAVGKVPLQIIMLNVSVCTFSTDVGGVRSVANIWQVWPAADTGGHPVSSVVLVAICG